MAPDEMVFRSLIDACGRLGNVDLAMKVRHTHTTTALSLLDAVLVINLLHPPTPPLKLVVVCGVGGRLWAR